MGGALRRVSAAVLAVAVLAARGDARGGLFTKYLARWLRSTGVIYCPAMVRYVRSGVIHETGGWQRPVLGSL